MRYLVQFDNLPTKLPMSDQARGKLQRELQETSPSFYPHPLRVISAWKSTIGNGSDWYIAA